jgi:hypothetical protein
MRRRERMLEELDQEIRGHIEMETQENVERGLSLEEGRFAASRKFGNVTRVTESSGINYLVADCSRCFQAY